MKKQLIKQDDYLHHIVDHLSCQKQISVGQAWPSIVPFDFCQNSGICLKMKHQDSHGRLRQKNLPKNLIQRSNITPIQTFGSMLRVDSRLSYNTFQLCDQKTISALRPAFLKFLLCSIGNLIMIFLTLEHKCHVVV